MHVEGISSVIYHVWDVLPEVIKIIKIILPEVIKLQELGYNHNINFYRIYCAPAYLCETMKELHRISFSKPKRDKGAENDAVSIS